MMQDFLSNNKDLDTFLKDRTLFEFTTSISHTDAVSGNSSNHRVEYTKTPNGLNARVLGHTINLEAPVMLAPVYIDKPWGREIWYTGIEKRGESSVVTENNNSIPISLFLSLAPKQLTNSKLPALLKVLDPKPVKSLGNLYLEVHEEKEEVYIVTNIDPRAWPGGVGIMRYGVDQIARQSYGSDQQFRAEYLSSVQEYEAIRQKVDSGLDVSNTIEERAKLKMDGFTSVKELRLGDVIKVPTWTPHSLQHGIRVIEFQTPTYERYIISFEQRVLTQEHWDSEHAITHMALDPPAATNYESISEGLERIARFEDFNVVRTDFSKNPEVDLSMARDYAIFISIGESCLVGSLEVPSETACLIPRAALKNHKIRGQKGTYGLIASPNK